MGESKKVDFSDLENYYQDRLVLTSKTLELIEDGAPKNTVATLNSAALEMAFIQKDIKEAKEKMEEWAIAVKKVHYHAIANNMSNLNFSFKAEYLSQFLAKTTKELGGVTQDIFNHPKLKKQEAKPTLPSPKHQVLRLLPIFTNFL